MSSILAGQDHGQDSLNASTRELLQRLIEQHRKRPGALLPLLHAVQEALAYVPVAALPLIAAGLNLSRAEVHGVASYYHFFRSEPPGRHLVQICRAEACQACGGEALLRQAEQTLACPLGQTRGDGALTLEAVYCLGLCATGPALQIDAQLHGRVTPQKLQTLAEALELNP
ncbi:formate dehydrogenase subunit gamma [Paucibacter oligotrophus]|uniref:Formate dehydrogenase subunit gamma n=1 Tax=Roseateles oligotrophus TaxID=1769250 RepID=A0A840L7N3_9BURK|nr:formate dehydrogenase subunit gamma [Roseateles oligotrophus]MBB4842692.1 formate dehydrogenase subunit gamma [Roseateles oligotrophus]